MYRDCPRETKWYLGDLSLDLPSLFYSPAHIVRYDTRPIGKLDDRESLVSPSDMPDRAIGIARFEVIFHEHHTSSDLQDERLGSKTSLFQSFDERKRSFRVHLEDEYISSDRIESFFVVCVDRDISSEELGMILGGDSYIA